MCNGIEEDPADTFWTEDCDLLDDLDEDVL